MKSITSEMNLFRKASCQLWNEYLMPGENVVQIDVENSFEIIERELLRCLVLRACVRAADVYRAKPIECIVAKLENQDEETVLVAEEDVNGNTRWLPTAASESSAFEGLLFYDFFDWNHYGIISYDYVRATDAATGKCIMLRSQDCSFWLTDAAAYDDSCG